MSSNLNRPPRLRSFLLRCWEERYRDQGSAATWRFSLEDTRHGTQIGFASVESLAEFLQQEFQNVDGVDSA